MGKNYFVYAKEKTTLRARILKLAQQKNHAMLRQKTVDEHRAMKQRLAEMLPMPAGSTLRPCKMAGVPCEWISFGGAGGDKVILYIHGGSWMFGNLRTAQAAGIAIAEATGRTVLVVEYRLAPEHPYPAGLEDCYAVYQALLQSGYAADNIMLFGDSAGGNLSLCLLHKLRQKELPLPAAVACASPVTDLGPESDMRRCKPDLFYSKMGEGEQDIFSIYAGKHDVTDPLISPVYGTLSGLPPILIHVGGDEALCADNINFAKKAGEQGGNVLCIVWPEMFHDFTLAGKTMRESRESLLEIAAFFKQHVG